MSYLTFEIGGVRAWRYLAWPCLFIAALAYGGAMMGLVPWAFQQMPVAWGWTVAAIYWAVCAGGCMALVCRNEGVVTVEDALMSVLLVWFLVAVVVIGGPIIYTIYLMGQWFPERPPKWKHDDPNAWHKRPLFTCKPR